MMNPINLIKAVVKGMTKPRSKTVLAIVLPLAVFLGGSLLMERMTGHREVVEGVRLSVVSVEDQKPLYVRFHYDAPASERYWKAIDNAGHASGKDLLHREKRFLLLDLLFPFLYGLALVASLLIVWGRFQRPPNLAWLMMPVAAAVLGDWIENLVQLSQLQLFLDGKTIQASWIRLASAATQMKLLFGVGAYIEILILVGLTFRENPEEAKIYQEFEVIKEELKNIFPKTGTDFGSASDLGSLHEMIHRHSRKLPLTALCLSGGGVRSATFCLGVLQALGRCNQLKRFHYLSTVSGGGYVGSWLSKWLKQDGTANVLAALSSDSKNKDCEPLAVKNLRSFSNFLAPRYGWSADTWSLVILYLRNLFLNWLILVPLLFAVLLLPRVHLTFLTNFREVNWYMSLAAQLLLVLAVCLIARSLPLAGEFRFEKRIWHKGCVWILCFAATLLVWDWQFCYGSEVPFAYYCESFLLGISHRIYGGYGPYHSSCSLWTSAIAVAPVLLFILFTPSNRTSRMIAILGTWVGIYALLYANSAWLWPALMKPYPDLRLFATFAVPSALFSYGLVATIWVGCTAFIVSTEADREWWAASCGVALAIAVAWVILHAIVFYLPGAVVWLGATCTVFLTGLGGAAGIATAVGGYFSRKSLGRDPKASNWFKEFLGKWGLNLGALLFIVLYVGVGGSLLTGYLSAKYLPPASMKNDQVNDASEIQDRANSATKTNYQVTAQAVNSFVSNLKEDLKKAQAQSGEELLTAEAALNKEASDLFQKAAREELLGLDTSLGRTLLSVHKKLEDGADIYKASFIGKQPKILLLVFACLVLFALLLSAFFGVNRFSLHSMYANRLVRAYLGACRRREDRHPDPLTGFDKEDNALMSGLFDRKGTSEQSKCLFHVINMTLNLVSGDRLEWQQRKGSSFTVSPLYAGSWYLKNELDPKAQEGGYRDVAYYAGGSLDATSKLHQGEPITLGKAMGISGAAVSPNMGYHSSRLVACVMTFFNLRLGWWLPNPVKPGNVWKRKEPSLGIWPLIAEALGKTTDTRSFVYLSDGGHFDNLGLYEMVRRRCRKIFVVDAGADPDYLYEDLAQTIRKIRADTGISIQFSKKMGLSRGVPLKEPFAVARILYSDVDDIDPKDDGLLVYVKPSIKGDEPIDISEYAANHCKGQDRFPQQSTMDQFFDESQFESYRMLGVHQGLQAMAIIEEWDRYEYDWDQDNVEKQDVQVIGKDEEDPGGAEYGNLRRGTSCPWQIRHRLPNNVGCGLGIRRGGGAPFLRRGKGL